MSCKFLAIILFLICLFLIVYIWNPGGIFGPRGGGKEQEIFRTDNVWVPFDFSPEGRTYVEAHIDTIKIRLEQMSGDLTDTRIADINKFFRKRGFITKHNGDELTGSDIEEYLRAERNNIKNIKFKLAWFYAYEDKDTLSLPPTPENLRKVVHYVWMHFKIEYNYKGKRIDPRGGRDDRHIRNCHWIDP